MRRLVPLVLVAACAHPAPPPTAPPAPVGAAAPDAPPPAAPTAALTGRAVDEGSFNVFLRDVPAGKEDFALREAADGWAISWHANLRFGKDDLETEGQLDVDGDYRPRGARIHHRAGAGSSTVTLARNAAGALAQKTTSERGEGEVAEERPSALYFGNIEFSHLTPLCTLAGIEARELAVFPKSRVKVSIVAPIHRGGRSLNLLAATIDDKTTVALVCDQRRLVWVRYPELSLEAVRQGFEDVREGTGSAVHKPEVPAGLADVPRSVVVRGATLACSLLLPADRSATFPGVVFVSGAGPDDRDDDAVTPDSPNRVSLFKHLAIALAQSGIASLRCDDRGAGASSGERSLIPLATLVADALSQLGQLRAEPGIDPDRLGLVGIEEGAHVAGLAAEKDPRLKALLLLGAPARPLSEHLLDVNVEKNRAQGFKDDYVERERKRMAALYAAVRDGKPLPASATPDDRQTLEPARAYLTARFRLDFPKVLQHLKLATLSLTGTHDAAPGVKDDPEKLRAAIGGHGTVKVYPELDDVFTRGDGHVDLEVIGDVATFAKKAL
jgi:hypothetical protein